MQNETLNVLLTRRSVRKYRPDQVDEKTLSAILEAGTYAPSGMGKQPAVIVAVRDPGERRAVMELNQKARGGSGDPYYGAPTILLVLADSGITGTFVEDGACVLNTMMVAAQSLGVSSCWVHGEHLMFDLPEGKALLEKWDLPTCLRGVGSLALGYAEGEPPEAKPRKEGYIKIV